MDIIRTKVIDTTNYTAPTDAKNKNYENSSTSKLQEIKQVLGTDTFDMLTNSFTTTLRSKLIN
jgi:hypothetical protein